MKKLSILLFVSLLFTGVGFAQFSVTFNVDMNDAEGFDAAAHEVYISGSNADETAGFAGDFAVWPQPGTEPAFQLTDADEDGIYTLTLTDVVAGDYIFKYFYIETGVPSWDNGDWPGGDNRVFTVTDDDVVLNDVFGQLAKVESLNAQINVHPNPSNGIFTVSSSENLSLEVLDITGKLVKTQEINGNAQVELNNAGMYFFRFSNENGSAVSKVIVK
jgi:hypothetical protein